MKYPKKPDLDKQEDHFNKLIDNYCQNKVLPYLVYLLNKAQERLWRHRIAFVQGMGTQFFTINGEIFHFDFENDRDYRLKHGRSPNRKELMLRTRLPWLVEFMKIIDDTEDKWNYCFGNIEPQS